MKKKIEEFNKDEELLDMAFQRRLNHMAHEGEKKDMYDQGKEEGKIEEKKESVLCLFQFKYPKEDNSFLDKLTFEQYQNIFMMLLEDKTIDEIKKYININAV